MILKDAEGDRLKIQPRRELRSPKLLNIRPAIRLSKSNCPKV
jgi:hypothetical protein